MPFQCPRCTAVFDSRYAVSHHAWKKPDEPHSDIQTLDDGVTAAGNAEEVTPQLLRTGIDDTDELDVEPEPVELVEPDDTDDERQADVMTRFGVDDAPPALDVQTDGGNPVFAHPPLPDGGTVDELDDDELDVEPECPSCGGVEWFDASAAGYTYGCPHCSTPDSWEVWN